jgi:hypothetical protein
MQSETNKKPKPKKTAKKIVKQFGLANQDLSDEEIEAPKIK